MPTTRREFIQNTALATLGLSGVGSLLPALASAGVGSGSVAPAADPVLVVVNLFGGNDGLNTVVPLDQYGAYRDLRPNVGLEGDRLITLAGAKAFALNPGMQAVANLFGAGKVAIITGVGSPESASGLFDHEASQQNLQTGDIVGTAARSEPRGWLGRGCDLLPAGELPTAIDHGAGNLLLVGDATKPLALSSLDGLSLYPTADSDARHAAYEAIQGIQGDPVGVRVHNRELRQQALQLSGRLTQIGADYRPARGVLYPDTYLGNALRDCAALVWAHAGVRAIGVGTGGFDTHYGQNDPAAEDSPLGMHEALLIDVSESVAAFQADLERHQLANRVVTLIVSEFGRRGYENNDVGTDHGLSSVLFAVGSKVKGGIYGGEVDGDYREYPDLGDLVLGGNLRVLNDFRSVYATVLERHLAVDADAVLDGSFARLGFLA